MKATAGEVYTVYNQYLKRYTACQVAYIASPDTVSKESWAVILSLDWAGDAPLTAEELPHLRPLYKEAHFRPSPTSPAAPTEAGVTAMMCISRSGGRPFRRNGGRPSRRLWTVTNKRKSAVSS